MGLSVRRRVYLKANLLTYLASWPPYTLENGFQGVTKHQGDLFQGFFSTLLCTYCSQKLPEQAPTKTRLHVLLIVQLYTCVCAIQLLPSLYSQSCDELFKSSSPTLFHTDTANNGKLCGSYNLILPVSTHVLCTSWAYIHTCMCELTFSFELIPHCLRQAPMGGRSSNTKIEDRQLHGEGALKVQLPLCKCPSQMRS